MCRSRRLIPLELIRDHDIIFVCSVENLSDREMLESVEDLARIESIRVATPDVIARSSGSGQRIPFRATTPKSDLSDFILSIL